MEMENSITNMKVRTLTSLSGEATTLTAQWGVQFHPWPCHTKNK